MFFNRLKSVLSLPMSMKFSTLTDLVLYKMNITITTINKKLDIVKNRVLSDLVWQ